jgi:DNA invertase Pin-like site-specific DNA recombinase
VTCLWSPRIDRLARSISDQQDVMRTLKPKGVRRERQLEGIAKAKAEGAYKGGTRRLDRETVRAMFVAGHPERRPIRLTPPRLPRIGPPFLRVSPHFQQACGLICLRI